MRTPAPTAPLSRTLQPWGLRAARWAAVAAACTALGGCAVWNSIFGEAPASTEPAAAPEGSGQVAIAPQALPPVQPASAAPEPVAPPPPPAPPEPVAEPAPVRVAPPTPTADIPPPSPLPKAPEPAKAMAVPTGPGFYINVGLFAVPTNGSNAVGILRNAGLPVFADTVESAKKGTLTRVRVGPYAKRAEAQAAAKKIKSLKLEAVVFERK